MKKSPPTQAQLKIEFKESKMGEPREIKVISLQKIQNNELNAKILNRQRPIY
ncbi:hypothetical protein [Flavobacterium marginilacus]|uniref:hypothetical protein n=1 Tax=Flavobacterium marginilacus TaxID=3003256 RepID=UPI00248E4D64|nr:hypothetical protein [Flavobacterium marginilacus]